MTLAIHKSNWGFSQDWISYCEQEGISYKIVDCYSSDIMAQLYDCDVLLWHHHHTLAKDKVFAKQLLFALEQAGKKVFPDFNTGWHFDDKLGQKYLLEAIGAPLVPTYALYDKNTAFKWIEETTFPKVFKLRGGAGAANVKLIYTKNQAQKLVNTAFGIGFPSYDKLGDLRENIRKYRLGKTNITALLKSFRRLLKSTEFARIHGPERGYVLFQEFIPDNKFDIRVITIGSRAFALKRLVRDGDFRASGSGYILYDKHEIDERCIEIAFNVSKKLDAQCVAYDFVFDEKNQPLIVEINYGFAHEAYFPCPGYWDEELIWYEESFNATHWMIDLFREVKENNVSSR
jgi:glutathione synthase/RimK-type ligase-like ATP-grasp enzyme